MAALEERELRALAKDFNYVLPRREEQINGEGLQRYAFEERKAALSLTTEG